MIDSIFINWLINLLLSFLVTPTILSYLPLTVIETSTESVSSTLGQTYKEQAIDNKFETGLYMTGKNQWLILTFDKIYEVQFLIVYLYNNNRVRVEIGESSDVGGNSLCVYIPTSYSSIPGRSFQCNAAMKIYGKYVILNTENCFDFWLSEIKIYGDGKD